MKIALIILGILVILGGVFYWYSVTQAKIGSLNIYNGDVEVVRGQSTSVGRTGDGIKLNDTLQVKDGSRASIILKDGTEIRLEAGTKVQVKNLEYRDGKISNAVLELTAGRIWTKAEPLASDGTYEVETPTVVAAIRGTSFNFDYLNETNKVYVFSHQVGVALLKQRDRVTNVSAGQLFVIRDLHLDEDFAAGPTSTPETYIDDWIVFNQGLDGESANESSQPAATDEGGDNTSTSTPETQDSGQTISQPPQSGAPESSSAPTSGSTAPQKTISSLTLTNASNQRNLQVHDSLVLKAQAKYSDGSEADVTNQVSWAQSPELGNFAPGGFYTALLPGSTSIRAQYGGSTSNAVSLNISQAVTLSSISVSCTLIPSQQYTHYVPPSAQCQATAHYSDNSSADITSSASWSVSGSAAGQISSSGYYVPAAAGSATIYASSGGKTGSASLIID